MTGTEGALSRGVVNDGCRERYASIALARRVLGYKVRVGLEEGIRRSCEVSLQRNSLLCFEIGRGIVC